MFFDPTYDPVFFKLMPKAKRIPANIDKVLKDVYERLLVKHSPKRFIAKVARDMVDKRENHKRRV
jgi:hypothetical protein